MMDPLQHVGESLTLNILGFLSLSDLMKVPRLSKAYAELFTAHASGIFRPACRRSDVDEEHLIRLVQQEEQNARLGDADAEDAISVESLLDPWGPSRPSSVGKVDWKEALRQDVIWRRNWKHGRCVDKWITPHRDDVWRFKLDADDGCCITTSRDGSISVLDTESSTPLFSIMGVRPFAHLEFANGFAVFDNGHDPMQLEVWRNRHALARSSHKNAFGHTIPDHRPYTVEELLWRDLHLVPTNYRLRYTPATPPLTRGNLAFYRHIQPPHPCRAFRARIDYKGTPEERSVICLAGDHGVFIYDLEEGSLVQHIKTNEADEYCVDMQYVELDDEHVFLCTIGFFYVFSRQTHKLLIMYPDFFDSEGRASVGMSIRFDPSPGLFEDEEHEDIVGGQGSTTATTGEPQAKKSRTRRVLPSQTQQRRLDARNAINFESSTDPLTRPDSFGFDACHYTTDDLICTGNGHRTFVIRQYKSILRIPDDTIRRRVWIDHTIALEIDDNKGSDRFSSIATDRSHVVLVSSDRVLFFDTATLPSLCEASGQCGCQQPGPSPTDERASDNATSALTSPPSSMSSRSVPANPFGPVLHVIQSLDRSGLRSMSCVQADKDNIYLTYRRSLDAEEGATDAPMPNTGRRARRVDCIRAWSFAAR